MFCYVSLVMFFNSNLNSVLNLKLLHIWSCYSIFGHGIPHLVMLTFQIQCYLQTVLTLLDAPQTWKGRNLKFTTLRVTRRRRCLRQTPNSRHMPSFMSQSIQGILAHHFLSVGNGILLHCDGHLQMLGHSGRV